MHGASHLNICAHRMQKAPWKNRGFSLFEVGDLRAPDSPWAGGLSVCQVHRPHAANHLSVDQGRGWSYRLATRPSHIRVQGAGGGGQITRPITRRPPVFNKYKCRAVARWCPGKTWKPKVNLARVAPDSHPVTIPRATPNPQPKTVGVPRRKGTAHHRRFASRSPLSSAEGLN